MTEVWRDAVVNGGGREEGTDTRRGMIKKKLAETRCACSDNVRWEVVAQIKHGKHGMAWQRGSVAIGRHRGTMQCSAGC